MAPLTGAYGWYTLALVLFLTTFGPLGGLWLIFYLAMSLIGFSLSILMIAKSRFILWPREVFDYKDKPTSAGLPKLILDTCKEPKKLKIEKRMTNSSVIDDVLQEILDYIYRDYIHSWYHKVSEDQHFHYEIRNTFQKVIIAFAERARDVDLIPYLTTRLVDDFASHIRLYRRTLAKIKEHKHDNSKPLLDLESTFFDLELEMERDICRDQICLSDAFERRYLQEICEVIMFLLLPPDDFHNKILRYVIREVLVNVVLLPTMNYLSDPDHINQTLTLPCKDAMFNNESFLTIMRTTDSIDELMAIKEKVEQEIARQRSKDSGGDDDTTIKQQLSSLLFVKSLCEARTDRLNRGGDETDSRKNISSSHLMKPGQKLYNLSFDVVLNNNVALPYFIEFMTSIGMQHYLFFYLTVEGYRVSAEQQISASLLTTSGPDKMDLETLHDAALNIFNQYLSEKASPRLKLDELLVDIVLSRIKHGDAMDTIFNDVQAKVYDTMQEESRCFPAFKRSPLYIKLLIELDLLQDGQNSNNNGNISSKPENGTTEDQHLLRTSCSSLQASNEDLHSSRESLSSFEMPVVQATVNKSFTLSAHISNTGICQDHGKSYAVYLVSVLKKTSDGTDTSWDVYRRFSDFYDLHSYLQSKYDSLSGLVLPSKKTFDNMNKEFLEKRKVGLNTYLQTLLNPGLLNSHKGMIDIVHQFLENLHWEREKSDLARKVDSLVNPFKSSVRSVGNMVRSVPNSLADGVAKVRNIPNNMIDGVGKILNVKPSNSSMRNEELERGKVSASLDFEGGEDSIPLHIMLLLMDEIFDLKNRNQWLRRRIVAMLQQIAKTMFGDSINRKIIDNVAYFTSPDQIAEYFKLFRDTFWPGGKLAEGVALRDYNTKMRTRVVCKTKLYASLSDELKHLVGSETTRQGVMLVFNMFQHQRLNRRLMYVIFEGLLQTIFPDNKFFDMFRKIHSQSPRLKNKSSDSKLSVQSKNQFR